MGLSAGVEPSVSLGVEGEDQRELRHLTHLSTLAERKPTILERRRGKYCYWLCYDSHDFELLWKGNSDLIHFPEEHET